MIIGLVPAAGRSSRLGRAKATLPFRGRTIAGTVAELLREGGCAGLRFVVAPGEERLARLCSRLDGEVIYNRRPERGMLSSIVAGLDGLDRTSRLVVHPVDFPAVAPETVATLLAALDDAESGVAVPLFRGRRGHPIALRGAALAEVERLDPEVGLRQIFDRIEPREVAVDDEGCRLDVDRWSDYLRLAG